MIGGMSTTRLTETSYIVLGLLEQLEPATPYDLKQLAAVSTVNFWTVPHTQIYTECARLAEGGLLEEERESTGRRRRIYRLTQPGREALQRWRSDASGGLYELRDVGDPEAVLRRRPEAARGRAGRGPPAALGRIRGAARRARPSPGGVAARARAGDRPRARVPALLVASELRGKGRREGRRRSGPLRGTDPPGRGAAAPRRPARSRR